MREPETHAKMRENARRFARQHFAYEEEKRAYEEILRGLDVV